MVVTMMSVCWGVIACSLTEILGHFMEQLYSFISGAFTKFQKVTISFVMSVTSNNSAPTGRIFVKFGI
jgi:hypothetical protein